MPWERAPAFSPYPTSQYGASSQNSSPESYSAPDVADPAHYQRMADDAKRTYDAAMWAFGPPSVPQTPSMRQAPVPLYRATQPAAAVDAPGPPVPGVDDATSAPWPFPATNAWPAPTDARDQSTASAGNADPPAAPAVAGDEHGPALATAVGNPNMERQGARARAAAALGINAPGEPLLPNRIAGYSYAHLPDFDPLARDESDVNQTLTDAQRARDFALWISRPAGVASQTPSSAPPDPRSLVGSGSPGLAQPPAPAMSAGSPRAEAAAKLASLQAALPQTGEEERSPLGGADTVVAAADVQGSTGNVSLSKLLSQLNPIGSAEAAEGPPQTAVGLPATLRRLVEMGRITGQEAQAAQERAVAYERLQSARLQAAIEGITARDAGSVMKSAEFSQLRAAYDAGRPTTVTIGGRPIQYDPGLPPSYSGMTDYGRNGFTIGPGAFRSAEEIEKTILQELYRLNTTTAGARGEFDAAASAAETRAARDFAERMFKSGVLHK